MINYYTAAYLRDLLQWINKNNIKKSQIINIIVTDRGGWAVIYEE